jgi:AraC family transcriptional regulator
MTHRIDYAGLRGSLDYTYQPSWMRTPAQLTQVAGVSVFHFSPSRYISRMRLEKAMAEIAADNLSLAEIAFRAGFSSQASFTRAFYRMTRLTPGEYRARRVSDLSPRSFALVRAQDRSKQ